METKVFIRAVLEELHISLESLLEGLSPAEIDWQPAQSRNSIGLILFHTARSEDFFIHELVRKQVQVWEKDKWYDRLNFPAEERGRHYEAEQVNAFASPGKKELMNYYAAVRKETLNCLDDLETEDFNRLVTTPRGKRSVGGFFSLIVRGTAQHIGEMTYLCSLQKESNQKFLI